MNNKSCFSIFGIEIFNQDVTKLSGIIYESLDSESKATTLACANPHSLSVSLDDNDFYMALQNTNVLAADGVGIVIAMRLFKKIHVNRITGYDLFVAVMEILNKRKGTIVLLGSTEEVLDKLENNISQIYPAITVLGKISPPFHELTESENDEIVAEINQLSPDVVWVGMTAPKQEKWVYKNSSYINTKLIGSIGAVFDFVAGTKPRAPKWLCDFGFEWLYRFYKEPVRMWKRNIISMPNFMWNFFIDVVKGK